MRTKRAPAQLARLRRSGAARGALRAFAHDAVFTIAAIAVRLTAVAWIYARDLRISFLRPADHEVAAAKIEKRAYSTGLRAAVLITEHVAVTQTRAGP
jgi:hypothetical protein